MSIKINPQIPCLITVVQFPEDQIVASVPLSQIREGSTIKGILNTDWSFKETKFKLMFLPLSLSCLVTSAIGNATDNAHIIQILKEEHSKQ